MAGDTPTTPTSGASCMPAQNADFTQSTAPPTPSNLQRAKRFQAGILHAPPKMDGGKGSAATEHCARGLLLPKVDEMLRSAHIRADVLRKLGEALDSVVSSYAGDANSDHRRLARELCQSAIAHLTAQTFAETGVHVPYRVPSTAATSSSGLHQPHAGPSWSAGNGSSGRSKSVAFADIPRPNSSGKTAASTYASVVASSTTSLVHPSGNVSVPETWWTYVVPAVPVSFRGLDGSPTELYVTERPVTEQMVIVTTRQAGHTIFKNYWRSK